MKTLILTAVLMILSFSGRAGNDDKYCAKIKDGKTVVMYKGTILSTEARLDNGAIVKPDGTVSLPDGVNLVLNDGECIHKDGSNSPGKAKSATDNLKKP